MAAKFVREFKTNPHYVTARQRLEMAQFELREAEAHPETIDHDITTCPVCPSWLKVYQVFCPTYYALIGADRSTSLTLDMFGKVVNAYNKERMTRRINAPELERARQLALSRPLVGRLEMERIILQEVIDETGQDNEYIVRRSDNSLCSRDSS